MRHTEFWDRMRAALGDGYYATWADQFVMADLDGRTAKQALDDGVAPKQVWRAVWAARDLPENLR